MASQPRMKEKIVNLTTLYDNLSAALQEMPHLARDHAAIGSVIARAYELESLLDAATGEVRRINRERVDLEKEGRELRNRVVDGLRGALGADNVELAKFGIRPRPRLIRRRRLRRIERLEQLVREGEQARAELEALEARRTAADPQSRAGVAGSSLR
jgi:hypothetical protein